MVSKFRDFVSKLEDMLAKFGDDMTGLGHVVTTWISKAFCGEI